METYLYLLLIEDDTDPSINGPFVSESERNSRAMEWKKDGFDGGLYPLDIRAEEEPFNVETWLFQNEGFEEVEP